MDLGCIFTLNCIPNGLFFEIWDVGAFDCDFKSRSGWFEILFTRPISQIAVIKFRFRGICDILEPRSYHKSQIFQNLRYSSNPTAFPTVSFSSARKMQTAQNMLNRQNQPKKHTICTQVYAKSLNLRLLAYVLPLQAALTRASNPPQPIKRMLNRQI